MKFIAIILLFLLIGCYFIISSEGCKCASLFTPERAYCNAEWVAHAKILEVTPNEGGVPTLIKYKIQSIDSYKLPSSGLGRSIPSEVYTPSESAACGVLLEKDHEYLLAGTEKDGKMQISRCSQFGNSVGDFEWIKVSQKTKDTLKNKSFKCPS